MSEQVEWKIWYGDESTYSNLDGPPQDAPGFDVQIINVYDNKSGRKMIMGADVYIYRDGDWIGEDKIGAWFYFGEPGYKIVKLGRMMHKAAWLKIYEMADADLSLPSRSAWHQDEYRP